MEPYKQSFPALGLSIERNTPSVPADGRYYVVLNGELKGQHRGLKQAQAQYKRFVADSGWKPPSEGLNARDPSREAVDRYLDQLEDYWSSAHKHARRGGKTMYRS